MAEKSYWVYVNVVHKKSVGHVEPCGSIKLWGGETTGTGTWLGPFKSTEDAEAAGKVSGEPFHWCGNCSRRIS